MQGENPIQQEKSEDELMLESGEIPQEEMADDTVQLPKPEDELEPGEIPEEEMDS
jgi:hypothetical protein